MTTIRKSVPVALVVLFLALAVYQFALNFSSGASRDPSGEMVSKWEDHVQALREALPVDVSQVEYMDDSTVSGDSALFDINEFQLMQYSMAPAALQMGVEQEWIIANFNNDEDLVPWLNENLGKYDVQGFGFGLYLIHDLEN